VWPPGIKRREEGKRTIKVDIGGSYGEKETKLSG
jgi:hypothetical protein